MLQSNNMVIQSVVQWAKSVGLCKPHIILSNVEHVATSLPIEHLAGDGVIGKSLGNFYCKQAIAAICIQYYEMRPD